ncbi:hypothetical protein Q5P01_011304 [Channa striata]|uniref:Meiotic recombination protein REC8 homolog n=1 Tax=Channa striata TaxID=64152 RepID=A0AA88SMR7_CHASR|nr:hypothetical protein Q5P01_011304 [Channa striata]
MFYYPTVLKRHSGCFSTIWLVATKGIRVPRRDFLKVNIKRTCEDIMNYILEQVPPPCPGLPRPRFSLYLSSQLQYGVIVVYHRQCAILLEELHSIVAQLLKQRTSKKIDMDECRQLLVFPDALSLLEETEGAPDPLFGVMYTQPSMPSPSTLIQHLREASPDGLELPRPAAAVGSAITASPETITLIETEPVAIPTAEFEGVDLVDQHPDTIDFLLAETDQFPFGDVELLGEEVAAAEQEKEIGKQREEDLKKERTKELTSFHPELQPTPLLSEDALLLPQEEPGLSVEKPETPAEQLTPVSPHAPPSPPSAAKQQERASLELEEVASPELITRRRRRRRQLTFFDLETQLSQEVLQRQIDDVLTETRRPPLLPPPSHRSLPAADLFNKPCNILPEEVQFLWRQSATVTPLSGSDLQVGERGPESTDSEKEREREMLEALERKEERPQVSPMEVPREVTESEILGSSAMGTLPLESSDQRDVSREASPMFTSEREGSPVSRSVSTLQDIPEVVDDLQERIPAEFPGLLPELVERAEAPLLFQSLLPPEVNRRTVSVAFQRLLEALTARKVQVEQNQPYGDILIFPGPSYEDSLSV